MGRGKGNSNSTGSSKKRAERSFWKWTPPVEDGKDRLLARRQAGLAGAVGGGVELARGGGEGVHGADNLGLVGRDFHGYKARLQPLGSRRVDKRRQRARGQRQHGFAGGRL